MHYDRNIPVPVVLAEVIRGLSVDESVLIEDKTYAQVNHAIQGVRYGNEHKRYRTRRQGNPKRHRVWRLPDARR